MKKKIEGKYVRIRPSEKLIESEYKVVEAFWNSFFEQFPKAKGFINNPGENEEYKTDQGGLFYLRPVGQEIIAMYYRYLKTQNKLNEFKKIKKIEENLNSTFWNYILYNPHKGNVLMNKGNALNYLIYNFGTQLQSSKLKALKSSYYKNSGDLKLNLPAPLFK